MTLLAASAQLHQFTIGNVLGTSFAVLRRNIVAFGIFALGFGLFNLVAEWAVGIIGSQIAAAAKTDAPVTWGTWAPPILFTIAVFFASMVISSLATAAVSYGVFQDLRGQRAGTIDCLVRGLASILPVVIASLAFSLIVSLASILLLIPGVLIWLAYWLYVPAIVVEKRGIIDSFRRSAFLTRGRRWRVVGLWLVAGVASLLVSSGLTRVLLSATGGWRFGALYISEAAMTAFYAAATAVSYYCLRADKEGVGIDDIAAVFD
jgi:hypothetical protein